MRTAPDMDNERLREQVAALQKRVSELESELAVYREGRALGHLTPPLSSATEDAALRGDEEAGTEQKIAEEALARRQREYETLVENSPDVIARYAPGLYCLYINQASRRVSGLEPEQVIGRTLKDAGFSDEVLVVLNRPVAEAFRTGKEQSVEFPFLGADGLNYYQSRIVPERGPTGSIESVLAITEDITERKQAEEALRLSNDELRRANADLDEFAYVASHDLREPLRMVNVYTQLLLRRHVKAQDGEAQTFAGIINDGVSRMEELIGDVLSYSRAVYDDSIHQPVDLGAVLNTSLATIGELVNANSAVITADPLPQVLGNDFQLVQVFNNVLSNAIKYRKPNETPHIHVSAYRQNGECIVRISDNGIGFKPQYAERIFGLFKRLHKTEYPGTGLGLAICRRIIGRFGGRIWAESAGEGNGASLFFALPYLEAEDKISAVPQVCPTPPTKPPPGWLAAHYSLLVSVLRSRAIFLTDPEGRVTSWHPGVEHLLGYAEREWIGQSASIIFTAEDLANKAFEAEMEEAVRAGEAADIRWHQRKDGTLIFIDGVLVCLRNEAGTIVGFSKLMRDATDGKRAEEAVRASEERLRFAQEGAQLGIWDWDITSNVVARSEIHYRIFGREPRDEADDYTHWLSELHPADRARMDEETRLALKAGEMESEFRILRPDGQVRWIHARGKVYFDDDKPVRMVRIVRDITGEKAAEDALADSEARKTAILSASLDAVLVMDSEGLLQEFNPAAEKMFGYERGQAIGRSLGDLIVPPHLREAHHRGLTRYLQTGEARVLGQRIEIQAMRSDGTEFPVELAILRVPVHGAPIFAGYVRDITERKRAEDLLRRSNEELAEFAHVVAHDLQTPLRTVRSYTQLLVKRYEGQLDPSAGEFFSYVLSGTKTMETLIRGLLDYAIAGEEAPREPVNLSDVVQNVISGLATQIDESGAEIIYDELPTVSANPIQMQQLFQNLIGNAVKYRRPEAAPEIRIGSDSSSNRCLLSISDNGQGIPIEQRERIFAPLSRLHGQDIPGTGLGLAVCKKIIEHLGGRIWVESTPGQGSTFHFSVPAKT
jgi:PAS domain S-box-containing protein